MQEAYQTLRHLIKSESFREVFLSNIVQTILKVVFLFIAAKLIVFILKKTVFSFTKLEEKVSVTIQNLVEKIVYVIFFIAGLFTVLEALGINTSSLIATAGVGGVAIGFGAQSLVKDVISGFFILIEGQYYVGDEVVIEGVSGIVVDFGLKSTRIKDFETGAIHIFPNGIIEKVENRSIDDQYSKIFVDIPYNYELNKLFADVRRALKPFEEDERVLEGPILFGLVDGPERYNRLFIRATVINGATYAISREMRKAIHEELLELGYELSSPIFPDEIEAM